MKERKIVDIEDLLNKVAHSMGAKVVTWNTVEETIDRNISFGKIIETTKYITKPEMKRLEEKSRVY